MGAFSLIVVINLLNRASMEGMQPPTPKEDFVVAKNPFETDFDIPAQSTQVTSSFFNYTQNGPDMNSFGQARSPAYMQSSGPMFAGPPSGMATGQRAFPYPNVPVGGMSNEATMSGFAGDVPNSPFSSSMSSGSIRPLLQPQDQFSAQPISNSKIPAGNTGSSKSSKSANKSSTDNQASGNRSNVQSNSSQSTATSNANLPSSPLNANAPITHLNIAICASCRQDIVEGDDRLNCFSGCSSNSYHRMCAGLSKNAYDLFMKEQNVEWVCDYCISARPVPLIKQATIPAM